MKIKTFLSILFLVISQNIFSQNHQAVPFDSDRWIFEAGESRMEDYLGRRSLFLKGGIAYIKDSEFLNGIIEFDIAFDNKRGFTGVIWRMQDTKNYEEFYFRPHQSGNPDANQYQPVFNDAAAWQLYYGEKYSVPVSYKYNSWMPVKIVVADNKADIYINDMSKPALLINDLKREIKPGKTGITVSNFAPAHFSNFKFTSADKPELIQREVKDEVTPGGSIMSWQVSGTFDEKTLQNKYDLTTNDKKHLTWKALQCEKSGLANLSTIQGIGEGKNTVFARVIISSANDHVKKLEFGYSDRVKIYLNDKLLYSGNNNYLSRDYRFLGTIGYFDEVYLTLNKGDNELMLAVSEDFGGWGILAKIEDMDGIGFK